MLGRLPHNVENSIDLFHLFPALGDIVSRYLLLRGKLFADFVFGNGKMLGDAVIEAQTARRLMVQRLHITDEFLTLIEQLFRPLGILLGRFYLGDFQDLIHLFEEMLLGGLVGVQFQTERGKVDLLKP